MQNNKRLSAKEGAAMLQKQNAPGNSKFFNERTTIDDINFASKAEAKYYGQLKMRWLAKEIKSFRRQVKYRLWIGDVWICDYIADFVINENDGKITVVDVKSEATENLPVFRMKRALMQAIFKIEVKTWKTN